MTIRDQTEVLAFLSQSASYGLRGEVEHIETHISHIFLIGDRAFKLKRAVKLPYVDFSTSELRLNNCQREVALNTGSAPGLYIGVRQIVRKPGGTLAFGDVGKPIDAVVEMKRFDQNVLADRMAASGQLTPELMTAMAGMVARLHAAAPVICRVSGSANISAVLDINEAAFISTRLFCPLELDRLNRRFREALAAHAEVLDHRERTGKVRRCHGDLHLRNICVLNGVPYPFDCIEFNEQIATVDVLYDLAFLLMDLWHRGLQSHANLLANRYFDQTGCDEDYFILPFLMAVRAAVRAHVVATQLVNETSASSTLSFEARSYFTLAQDLLGEYPPTLVGIGGLSGSGKTTIAEATAPRLGMPPGARIVESDRIRKELHGVSAETRLAASAYRPEMSERVYRDMAIRSRKVISAGGCVVADAVFDLPESRRLLEAAAADDARFSGFWLVAPPDKLRERVANRPPGPSDADLSVLEGQLARTREPIEWQLLGADRPVAEMVAQILPRMHSAGSRNIYPANV